MSSALSGTWPTHRAARIGPFEYGGALYALTRTGSTLTQVSKSIDGGVTWTTVGPSFTLRASYDIVHIGNSLYIVTAHGVVSFRIIIFDLDTEGVIDDNDSDITTFTNTSDSHPLFLSVRSNGDYVVFYQAATERIMGTDYRRIAYSIWNGSSWSTTVPNFQGGQQLNYDARGAVLGSSDRVHMAFSVFSTNISMLTLSSTGSTSLDVITTTSDDWAFMNWQYPITLPAFNSINELAVLGGKPSINTDVVVARSPATTQSTSWTAEVIDNRNVQIGSSNPGALVYDNSNILHAFYVDGNSNIRYLNDQGTGDWTTPELFAVADTQGISAGPINNGNAISVLYNDGGTVTYDSLTLSEPDPITEAPALTSPSKTTTSIALEWTAIANADTYELQRDGMQIDQGTNLSYNDMGLEPDTTHTYRVRGVNQDGPGPWSPELVVATEADEIIPDDPGGIKLLYLRRVT